MDAAAIKNKDSFYHKISFFGDGFGDSISEGKANAFWGECFLQRF